jgi:hypothetical protein
MAAGTQHQQPWAGQPTSSLITLAVAALYTVASSF